MFIPQKMGTSIPFSEFVERKVMKASQSMRYKKSLLPFINMGSSTAAPVSFALKKNL